MSVPARDLALPQHLVVPLFQRPYVWDEDEQWAPLWHDVRRMAELRLQDPYTSAAHFLGAIIVQAQESVLGNVQANIVIDGQQRLTTPDNWTDLASRGGDGPRRFRVPGRKATDRVMVAVADKGLDARGTHFCGCLARDIDAASSEEDSHR